MYTYRGLAGGTRTRTRTHTGTTAKAKAYSFTICENVNDGWPPAVQMSLSI